MERIHRRTLPLQKPAKHRNIEELEIFKCEIRTDQIEQKQSSKNRLNCNRYADSLDNFGTDN